MHTYIQADGQTDIRTYRQVYRYKSRQTATDRHIHIQADRQKYIQSARQANIHPDTYTYKQAYRQ